MKGEEIVKRFSAFAFVTIAVLSVASPVFAQGPGGAGADWKTITAGFAMVNLDQWIGAESIAARASV